MSLTLGKSMRFLIILSIVGHLLGASVPATASKNTLLLASAADVKSENAAPDFELQDLDGNVHRLSQYIGKRPVLLYFWATWCPHCVASRPQIAAVREKMPESELQIFGINVGAGDSLQRVKRFQKGHPTSWPILYDADEKVTQSYGVQGIPLYVLVNKKGEIVYRGHELPDIKEYLQ